MLRLPGVDWWLQWRGDGFWRELSDLQHRDELNGVHTPDDDEWVRWSGLPQPQARGGAWSGTPTWWLVYGELPGSVAPTVELADGTRPPVLVLGRVWACEWRTHAQPGTVRVEGEQFELPFAEPFYRRPPSPTTGPGRQGQEPHGWFRT
ncbi:hypothetical protein Aco03nite_065000 [Actinoplanes couchii]|uniref:Uncharacterized protein n=2 Tax=Actinoplanes couchii TaxID=403638 RepID=A0ABQ3XHX9_9ACTN|nr:hypothetical protein Aco03nite_065000 [Actinoplanes couchii]